jgi:hypothetical protein
VSVEIDIGIAIEIGIEIGIGTEAFRDKVDPDFDFARPLSISSGSARLAENFRRGASRQR